MTTNDSSRSSLVAGPADGGLDEGVDGADARADTDTRGRPAGDTAESMTGGTVGSAEGSTVGSTAVDAGTEPGDFVEFVAAESSETRVHDGVPGRGWDGRFMRLVRQLVKFGLVGGVGFVIDLSIFNLLILTVLAPDSVEGGHLIAKTISTLVAIATNWLGNRLWTFRHHRRSDSAREGFEFLGVSLAGLVIGLIPLWVSHDLMGWTSVLANNIASIVGLGLGSIFRFALYRFWVFSPSRRRVRDLRDGRPSGYPEESARATRPDKARRGS